MWEGMEEMVLSRAKYVQVDGDIRHLKKHILENIDNILEFVFGDVLVLQAKVNEAYDLLKDFLKDPCGDCDRFPGDQVKCSFDKKNRSLVGYNTRHCDEFTRYYEKPYNPGAGGC